MHLKHCQRPLLCVVADLESKLPEGHKLPTKMLALMKLLEAEGPGFAQKELITLTGACHPAPKCKHLCSRPSCSDGSTPPLDSCACQTSLVGRASRACETLNAIVLLTRLMRVCMGPGGQDKDLIYQAHTGTTVLDALRCVPLGTAPRHLPYSVRIALPLSRECAQAAGVEHSWGPIRTGFANRRALPGILACSLLVSARRPARQRSPANA